MIEQQTTKSPLHDYNWVYFDVDDTLVMWYQHYEPGFDDKCISIDFLENRHALVPHKKHIELLKDLYAQGWTVVVWSAGGLEWAQTVTKALGLENHVHHILAKPYRYVDDLYSDEFMLNRVYHKFNIEDVDDVPTKTR